MAGFSTYKNVPLEYPKKLAATEASEAERKAKEARLPQYHSTHPF